MPVSHPAKLCMCFILRVINHSCPGKLFHFPMVTSVKDACRLLHVAFHAIQILVRQCSIRVSSLGQKAETGVKCYFSSACTCAVCYFESLDVFMFIYLGHKSIFTVQINFDTTTHKINLTGITSKGHAQRCSSSVASNLTYSYIKQNRMLSNIKPMRNTSVCDLSL
jgi:hypothetical protein